MPNRYEPRRELLIKRTFFGDSAVNKAKEEKMRAHRIILATAALLLVLSASACAAYSSQSGTDEFS